MTKNQKFIVLITGLVVAGFVFEQPKQSASPAPLPVNITGEIKPQATGLLSIKRHIAIDMNGYHVFNGYLDRYNNADMVGKFNDKLATAKCSGAETINCVIDYDNKKWMITFNMEGKK